MTGQEIRAMRNKAGISQLNVARLVKVPLAVISGIEHGAITGPSRDAVVELLTAPDLADRITKLRENTQKAAYSRAVVNSRRPRRLRSRAGKPQELDPTVREVMAMRKAAGLSMLQFGAMIGMTAPDITHVEAGEYVMGVPFERYVAAKNKWTTESLCKEVGADPKMGELGLHSATRKALSAAGITTLDRLLRMTEADLKKVPGIGMRSFFAIVDALGKKGLYLSKSPEVPTLFSVPPQGEVKPKEESKEEPRAAVKTAKIDGVFVRDGEPTAPHLKTDGCTLHLFTLVPGGVFLSYVGEAETRRRS